MVFNVQSYELVSRIPKEITFFLYSRAEVTSRKAKKLGNKIETTKKRGKFFQLAPFS